MDTAPLKAFATRARTDLIKEVAGRLSVVLAENSLARVESAGAVRALEAAVAREGVDRVIDRVAYTWFNRIIALRFMDANGYTASGVVSPAGGQLKGQPEVLAEAKAGVFDSAVVPARVQETITALFNGTRVSHDRDGEAYGLLLEVYCRSWNESMPFMFEREGDYTELLIPTALLAGESVRDRAVKTLTVEVCQDVEVIGWLYQFYISERKDEVFAGFKKNKKAGAAEIPAATQLFTPHWIVRYLVENSLGRLWLLNNPTSSLAEQMEYYIKPVDEETEFLQVSTPEELKIIDPAVGSGHMLTYAFDLLYAIYTERGYDPAEIPGLILQHNLYGTEIDPRAGALAAFALTMKAAARRKLFLKTPVQPSICVLENIHFDPDELDYLWTLTNDASISRAEADEFWNAFEHADTFGSLIQPDQGLAAVARRTVQPKTSDLNLLVSRTLSKASTVAKQAEYLAQRYSVIVANPPYMGSAGMVPFVGEWMKATYPDSKADFFAAFIEKAVTLSVDRGLVAMITMQSWMFLGGYEALRRKLIAQSPVVGMAHLGTGAFDSIAGEVVSTTAFILERGRAPGLGKYVRLVRETGESGKSKRLLGIAGGAEEPIIANIASFLVVPRAPLAYWVSESQAALYRTGRLLSAVGSARKGIDTGENARFVRFWFEVPWSKVRIDPLESQLKWVPYNKGGPNLRWYGNRYWVVDWEHDGSEIKAMTKARSRQSTIRNPAYFFREGFTYTTVSPGRFSARFTPANAIFDSGGGTYFADNNLMNYGALLNSDVAAMYFEFLAPTLNFQPGDVSRLPVAPGLEQLPLGSSKAVNYARERWDSSEMSWDFRGLELHRSKVVSGWAAQRHEVDVNREQSILDIEFENDSAISELYGIDMEKGSPGVVDRTFSPSEQVRDLISFAVGCIFGRYSLDVEGLVLADKSNTLADYLARVPSPAYMPDEDNVIPIVDGDWFEDDIVTRFRQFLRTAFGEEHFEQNLHFVTESLGVNDVRDYFINSFYDDHVKRYKKRPIYWLFRSSHGSFSALIYLHRFSASTVSTVLTGYLREFIGKLEANLEHQLRVAAGLGGVSARDIVSAQKEADRIRKVLVELREYEHEILFPLAGKQIDLDLDDGVFVNYQKLGPALKDIGLKKVSGDE